MAGINNFLGPRLNRSMETLNISKTQDNSSQSADETENNSTEESSNLPVPTAESQKTLEEYNNYLAMLGQVGVNMPPQHEISKAPEISTTTNPDGSTTTKTTEYDAQGRVVKETVVNEDKDGNVTESKVRDYEYDADGNISKLTIETTNKDGVTNKVVVTYETETITDKDGNVTGSIVTAYRYSNDSETPYEKKTETFDLNGNLLEREFEHYRADGTKYASNSIKYDESGHKTDEFYWQFDESERLTEEKGVGYDSNENIISKEHNTYEYEGDNKTPAIVTEYEYDSNGNVFQSVATITDQDGNVTGTKITRYKHETETITDKDGNDTGTQVTSYKYAGDSETPYEMKTETFDLNGNLLERAFEHYRADGTKYASNSIKYDENGRKTDEFYWQFDESERLTEEKGVEYDSNKKIISKEHNTFEYEGNNVTQVTTNTAYDYDSNGNVSQMTEITTDENGNVSKKETTEYNGEGDITTKTIRYFDADGKLQRKEIFNYANSELITKKEYSYNSQTGSAQTITYNADGELVTGYDRINKGYIGQSFFKLSTQSVYNVISEPDNPVVFGLTGINIMKMKNGFGDFSEMFLRMAGNSYNASSMSDIYQYRMHYAEEIGGCNKIYDTYNDTEYGEFIEQSLTNALSIYGYEPEMVKGYNFDANSKLSKAISDGSNIDSDMKNFVKNNIEKIKNGKFPINGGFNENKDLYYSIDHFSVIDGNISGTTLTLTMYDIYDFDQSYIDKLENTPENQLDTNTVLNAAGAAAMMDGRLTPYYALIEVKIDLTQIFSAEELQAYGIV